MAKIFKAGAPLFTAIWGTPLSIATMVIFIGLRAPGFEHGVGEHVKVGVRAVGDREGEGVLRRFRAVVLVADEVFVEVLFGEAGDGRGPVVEEFAVNGQLGDGEFQQLLGCVLVLGGELERRDQFNLPFCDD